MTSTNQPRHPGAEPPAIETSITFGTRAVYAATIVFIIGTVSILIGRETTEAFVNAGVLIGKAGLALLAIGVLIIGGAIVAARNHARGLQRQEQRA